MNVSGLVLEIGILLSGEGTPGAALPKERRMCVRSTELDRSPCTTRLWEELYVIMTAKASNSCSTAQEVPGVKDN